MKPAIVDQDVSAAALAEVLGLTRVRIEQLAADGVIPRRSRAKFPLLAGVRAYIAFLRSEERRSAKSASAARLIDARAEQVRQRTAREANELIETEEALSAVDEIFGLLKAELDGLPARVTRDMALRRMIEKELDATLERAADNIAKASAALAETGSAAASAGEVGE